MYIPISVLRREGLVAGEEEGHHVEAGVDPLTRHQLAADLRRAEPPEVGLAEELQVWLALGDRPAGQGSEGGVGALEATPPVLELAQGLTTTAEPTPGLDGDALDHRGIQELHDGRIDLAVWAVTEDLEGILAHAGRVPRLPAADRAARVDGVGVQSPGVVDPPRVHSRADDDPSRQRRRQR